VADTTALMTAIYSEIVFGDTSLYAGVEAAQRRCDLTLLMALDRLQPGDRFNVIEFNSQTNALYPAPVAVDTGTLSRAKRFVASLRARGGTEMLPALEAALAGERESSMLRQVVFLTDGAVGNEDAILRLIDESVGDRRLFTIGIGPAPNMFFMTRAAQFGRGTFTAIGDVREVREKMTALFVKLESPALTDIHVDWPAGADVWPRIVPDLYAGEPVVVSAQYNANAGSGNVALSGRRAGTVWGTLLPEAATASEPGVAVLWARAKIGALMDSGRKGASEDEVRSAVLDVALTHHLVSKYTSLVAVDVTGEVHGHLEHDVVHQRKVLLDQCGDLRRRQRRRRRLHLGAPRHLLRVDLLTHDRISSWPNIGQTGIGARARRT